MMRIGIGLAVALASGCVVGTPDVDEDLVKTSSVEQAVTVLPEEGFWVYDEIPPITGNCSFGDPDALSGLIFISHISATSYRVFPGGGAPSFTCTMSDAKFTCANVLTTRVDVFGLDADLTFQRSATGVNSDTEHGTGKQDVAVSCTGSQCGALAPIPCGFVHNFTVRKL